LSQNDEEAVLKSARFLYKSGYQDEARAVLAKLNTDSAKALLAKMGGAGKAKLRKNSSTPWPAVIAGYVVLALLAFGLGWILAPKTQEAVLLESINQELQLDSAEEATATAGRRNYEATVTAISATDAVISTLISATNAAAIQSNTATAEARRR
jgi:hypothetical protein